MLKWIPKVSAIINHMSATHWILTNSKEGLEVGSQVFASLEKLANHVIEYCIPLKKHTVTKVVLHHKIEALHSSKTKYEIYSSTKR